MVCLELITLLADRETLYSTSICVSVASQTWWEHFQLRAWWSILSADRKAESTREINVATGHRKKQLDVLYKCYYFITV